MQKQSKIVLASKDSCTGCGACAQSCAKRAISMKEDKEGFLQPHIDPKLCVGCHKCEHICPIISPTAISQNFETAAYAAINKNEAVRMRSSSGGVFYALANWTIEHGGVVFGARWDEKWEVMHDYTETIEGIDPFMRSKYVQSRIGETYKQAKKFLDEGRWVLYSGTPCQIGGLYAFLGKDYDKLMMVDLICHGVPSPGVWRKYLKEMVKDEEVIDINFRDKNHGWHQEYCYFKTFFKKIAEKQNNNLFFRGFLNNIYLRKSCYQCHFRLLHRRADITIADYWGVENILSQLDDDKGTSAVLIHTNKGLKVLREIENKVQIMLSEVKNIEYGNPSMANNPSKPCNRSVYFIFFSKFSFAHTQWIIDHKFLIDRLIRKANKIWQSL